eukprot:1145047-Pelagomonas_calceolata.AAC.2
MAKCQHHLSHPTCKARICVPSAAFFVYFCVFAGSYVIYGGKERKKRVGSRSTPHMVLSCKPACHVACLLFLLRRHAYVGSSIYCYLNSESITRAYLLVPRDCNRGMHETNGERRAPSGSAMRECTEGVPNGFRIKVDPFPQSKCSTAYGAFLSMPSLPTIPPCQLNGAHL